MDFQPCRIEPLVERFLALLKLEQSPAYDRYKRIILYGNPKSSSSSRGDSFFPSAPWRESFVGWCYKIVDLCEFYFSRETVDIAISYLDEYLYKKGGDIFDAPSESKRNLKILIITSTCIFLAIKLHESNHRFDIPTLIRLNNTHFTRQDIVDAERDILTTLDFQLSPPTVMSFIRIYLSFLKVPGGAIDGEAPLSTKAINHVTGLARFLSELSIYDLSFVDKEASKIALACVLTAFEGISRDAFPQAYRQRVVDCVFKEGKLDCTHEKVYECRIKLREMFEARRPGGIRPKPHPGPPPTEPATTQLPVERNRSTERVQPPPAVALQNTREEAPGASTNIIPRRTIVEPQRSQRSITSNGENGTNYNQVPAHTAVARLDEQTSRDRTNNLATAHEGSRPQTSKGCKRKNEASVPSNMKRLASSNKRAR